MSHDSPTSYDLDGRQLYWLDPLLDRGSDEFERVRQACEESRYVCAAENCLDRRLVVVATTETAVGPRSAHFRHRNAKHGEPGPRASAAETPFHLAAKDHLRQMGDSLGFDVAVEVHIDVPDGGTRRPDLVWSSDSGKPWAIEVQFSAIPGHQWRSRTRDLERAGYRPLWVWGRTSAVGRPELPELTDVNPVWREAYGELADVWIIEVGVDAGVAVPTAVDISQAHSFEFHWERQYAVAGRRPPWPKAVEYEPFYTVKFDETRGLICPDVDKRLAEVRIEAATIDTNRPMLAPPSIPDFTDNRGLGLPTIVALDQRTKTIRRSASAPQCACGVCHAHPEPDPLGRQRCEKCNCFTADSNGVHSWCLPRHERPRYWRAS